MKRLLCVLTALVVIISSVFAVCAASEASKPEYLVCDSELIPGPNSLVMDSSEHTFLYAFTPPCSGIYTFASDSADASVGFWGTAYYIYDVTGAQKSSTLTYTVTEQGPTLLIGISGVSECTLTVTREDYTAVATEVKAYENQEIPSRFSFEEGEHLLNVDAFDSEEDTAVYGDDGYYHLNAADGPILHLNFSGPINLREAQSLRQLTFYIDETTKLDCNAAMEQYISCADENWDVYPLTQDLAYMVQALANHKDWYTFLHIQEGNWLFNCCYAAEETEALCPTVQYIDVLNPSWYHHDLDEMVESGILKGKSQTTMDPDGMLTRAELVQLLYNIAGQPCEESWTIPFEDVSIDDWFYDAITWAYNQEEPIVNGMTELIFDPNLNITREQVAVILYRYSGCPWAEGNLNKFHDWDTVSNYAVDALIWATENEIIKGIYSDGKLYLHPRPEFGTASGIGLTTRAQAAVMMARYLEK